MTAHEAAVGATVEWYTPASLFDALGVTFDSDPAPAPIGRGYVPAPKMRGVFYGHVWLNPPYGPAGVPLIEAMIEHNDGLMLLPSRTETKVYQRSVNAAVVTCLLHERLWFERDDGYTGRSSFGSTLFAFGEWAAGVLVGADLGVTL